MNKVFFLVGFIVIIIFLYVNGVFVSRYEINDIKVNHKVHQQYDDTNIFKISWFKKQLIETKVEGIVDVNQCGDRRS